MTIAENVIAGSMMAAAVVGAWMVPTPPMTTARSRTVTVYVARVVDGDTFEITNKWSTWKQLSWYVRPRGLDTPEVSVFNGAKCPAEIEKGKQASAFAHQLMADKKMQVVLKNVAHDKYGGRLDADVSFKDGTSYADTMIKAGLAKPYDGGKKPDWCAV